MNSKNFVNYHILVSHSPSNLNRDDMGMQKSAIFGGVKRARISSQSLKRAVRKSEYYGDKFQEHSIRTREIDKLIAKVKEKTIYDESTIKHVIDCLKDKKKKKETNKDKKKEKGPIIPWLMSEIEALCEHLPKELNSKQDEKKRKKKIDDILEKIKGITDIALFGRMITTLHLQSIDGALAVAHAITTHAVDNEIDWFTAVDDLTEDDNEDSGAAHLDTTEFSAGVFYKYASLNLKQLQKNIGEDDKGKVLDIATHILHLLATVTPSGKQNSFAAHNFADFALVTLSDQPLSLANAFEKPIERNKKNGFLDTSIEKILEYQEKISSAYGLEDKKAFFRTSVNGSQTNSGFGTLDGLKKWLSENGE